MSRSGARGVTWRVRVLRSAVAVSLAGAATLVVTGFMSPPAHADSDLIGWTAQADANPFDFVLDDAAGLGGAHPLAEADLPEDTSDYESGPFGHALATIFWPGAAAGNLGSLSGELPLPPQLAAIMGNLNDPVRAEALYPSGPENAVYPANTPSTAVAQMTSHAGADGVWAKAGLSDVAEAGLFEIKGVHGATTATAASAANSTADASFSDLKLLGGLIEIGATTSSASATSDGVNPSGTSTTHLGAVTVAGHAVSFGSDGLVVGPAQTNVLGSLLTPTVAQVQQIISLLQLKLTPLPQTETNQAPAEEIQSGGLQVSFSLPSTATLKLDCSALPSQLSQLSVICTLPGLLQGASFTATIGRVMAQAIATPPFPDTGLGGAPTLPFSSGGTSGVSSAGSSVGSAGVSPASLQAAGPGQTPSVASPPATPVGHPGTLLPASMSTPVRAGLVILLLILAAMAGTALLRLTRVLDAAPLATCPLEERT